MTPLQSRTQPMRGFVTAAWRDSGRLEVDLPAMHSWCYRRLKLLGCPPAVASAVMQKVTLWVTECGVEWTVEHLKDIRRAYLRFLSGEKPETSHWISFTQDGRPKGPFRWFFSRNPKKMRTSLNALLIYTYFRVDRPTPKAIKKFLDAVSKSPPPVGALVDADEVVSIGCKTIHVPRAAWTLRTQEPPRLLTYQPTSKRMPGGSPEDKILESLTPAAIGRFKAFTGMPSRDEPLAGPDVYNGFVEGQIVLQGLVGPDLFDLPRTDDPVGQIAFLNECGLKLRAVANPNRLFQLALRPLSDALYAILKGIPEDHVYDHESGRERVRDALRSGCVVHSMDLSNASDTLPLSLQMHILWDLGMVQQWQYEALVRLFHAKWTMPEGYEPSVLQWRTGQPLGMRPSFPMFALLLHCIVRGCASRLGIRPRNGKWPYAQIGDDLAIWNDRLYDQVLAVLTSIEVEVSKAKGLTSNRAAEFAGFVITPERVWPTLKWKPITKVSALSSLGMFGPKGLALLPRSLRGRAAAVCCQPWPVGYAWNPKGLPLRERSKFYVTRWEKPVQSRASRLWQAIRNWYVAELPALKLGVSTQTSWFSDQENVDLVKLLLPSLSGMEPSLGISNLIGLASEKVPKTVIREHIELRDLMGSTARRLTTATLAEWWRSFFATEPKPLLLAYLQGLDENPTLSRSHSAAWTPWTKRRS